MFFQFNTQKIKLQIKILLSNLIADFFDHQYDQKELIESV